VAKKAAIREVKSMAMSCDPVGNVLLVKFSFIGGKDSCAFLPAHIVFWLLEHFPVNQDPKLPGPAPFPQVMAEDWDDVATPRIDSIQCKQFADAIRMTIQFEGREDLVVLMNRTNVELMRQFMLSYRPSLMDLGVF
jgi:hypothetical protein